MTYLIEQLSADVTLYWGDCRDVLHLLDRAAVMVADPPYGIGYVARPRSTMNKGLARTKHFTTSGSAPIAGDDRRFDPSHLLGFRKMAICGANHMEGLPVGGKWLVWDKRRDSTPDNHPDCELIWTNVRGADRIHRQKWRGIVREGEENISRARKLHPNQKPVALIDFVLEQIAIEPGATVVDPYMGSGSTGAVCIRRRLRFIGVEVDAGHFDTACRRLTAEIARRDPAQAAE